MNEFTELKKQLLFFCCVFAFALPTANAQSYGGFSFDPVVSCNGKTISMVARTDTWTDVLLFQFAMEWDSDVLEYVGTTVPNSTFQDLEFGNTNVNSGVLLTSWYDQSQEFLGISPDDEVAFTVIFNVVGDAGDQSSLAFTNAIPMEFYYSNNDGVTTDYTSDVTLVDGSVNVTSKPTVEIQTITNATDNNSSDGAISVNVIGGTPDYEILWTNGESGESLINLSAGNYKCTVTDANTCFTENGPFSILSDISSSNNNIEGLNRFDLSPNPANDFVNINVAFAKNEKATVRIIDVTGKVMYHQDQEVAAFTLDVPVNDFANGTYFVEIATTNGKTVEKLIVAK